MSALRRIKNRGSGATLVEFAGVATVFVPILIAVLLVSIESGYAYSIHSAMDSGARRAARDLAAAYSKTPNIQTDTAAQQAILTRVRIPNMINDNAQFSTPTWDYSDPPTVTVTVTYLGGQYGLPVFPNPDPLGLGPNFVINSTATYRLQ